MDTSDSPDTTNTRRALVPTVAQSEPWTAWQPAIQNTGVDTVEFSFDVEISGAMWNRLEEERQLAQLLQQTRKAVHVPDWLNAEIHPIGARGGYRFLLETPTFSIKLLKGVPNRPPIYVEMRAFGLHTHAGGTVGACEAACVFIRETLLADQNQVWAAQVISLDAARCSRLDLFLDWQGGWHPAFTAGDENDFVKRVHAEVTRRSADGQLTGYEIGKSAACPHLQQNHPGEEVASRVVPQAPPGAEWYALRPRH